MDALAVGDMVKVGPNVYSKVFMFTHKIADITRNFVELSGASGASILLTAGHYIPVDGILLPASSVSAGARLRLGNGLSEVVTAVRLVSGSGLYNPQTLQGDIVVNGIVASTYTTAVAPPLAHAILSPVRTLFRTFGSTITFIENGGGTLANALQSVAGDLVYAY
jgi:desert hedgehog